MNISANPVNLTGVRFINSLEYDFAPGTTLAPGARIAVARNRNAFLFRHAESSAQLASGAFLNGTGLNNGGEPLMLVASAGGDIRNFAYDDIAPWPLSADGDGYSLVLVAPTANPDHSLGTNWRASSLPKGTPGSTDSQTFTGVYDADSDHDGLPRLVEHALGSSDLGSNSSGISMTKGVDGYVTVTYTLDLAADDVVSEIQSSDDMTDWSSAFSVISSTPTGEGTVVITVRSQSPATGEFFIRLSVRTR